MRILGRISTVKDAKKRMIMLHAASKFTRDKQILREIYFTRIRCKQDQSAVVWNSSLTLKNISDLERVQRSAIRIIRSSVEAPLEVTLGSPSVRTSCYKNYFPCF